MRRAGELANLTLEDMKEEEDLLRVRINHSKTDQFGQEKFVPVEKIDSDYCPVKLWRRYKTFRTRISVTGLAFPSATGRNSQ
jgi:hypothetical protein